MTGEKYKFTKIQARYLKEFDSFHTALLKEAIAEYEKQDEVKP